MATPYRYDLFISYSSQDREWAVRMKNDLKRRRIENVFLDTERLEKGLPWEPSLREAVRSSRHLVVLWTQAARDSDWVSKETALFDVLAGESAPPGSRRLLCVRLDQAPHRTFESLQLYGELTATAAYAQGSAALAGRLADAWQGIVTDITAVVRSAGNETPLPLALLAMTHTEAAQLRLDETFAERVQPLSRTIAALNLASFAQLTERYGASRMDWRPFDGTKTVRELLDELLGKINALSQGALPGRTFRWRETDLLGGDIPTARAEIANLLSDLALIVIDPISLYHPAFFNRFSLLKAYVEREQTVLMTLAPSGMPPVVADLRMLIQGFTEPLLDFHFVPPVPFDRQYSTCYPHVFDSSEMEQAVRRRLGLYAHQMMPKTLHPAVDPGRAS
jgi:hypothetical protein